MKVGYTICYLGSIKIMGAYCEGRYTICYLGRIKIMGAYCEGMVYNMLSW